MLGPEEYEDEVYERTLDSLEKRMHRDDFDLETVKGEFEALSVYQGHGWVGRNAFKDAEIDGQILAYQVFLFRLNDGDNE